MSTSIPSILSDEQIAFYRENGYLLVKGLFSSAEAAEYRRAGHDVMARIYNAPDDVGSGWGSGQSLANKPTKLQVCHDVQFYDAAFAKLIVDERFTGAAAQILDTPNVQLHHTKMFVKPPENGAPFPMHQDTPYFPHDNHSMIAAILHFDDAPLEKGCVRVVPGSHKSGVLEHNPEGGWHLPLEEFPLETATTCPAQAGDALFFSYLTIHGSGINESDEARTTLLVQMRDPEDTPSVDTHKSQGQSMMLRGVDPTCRSKDWQMY